VPVLFEFSGGKIQEARVSCYDWSVDQPFEPIQDPEPGECRETVRIALGGMDRFFKGAFQDSKKFALFEVAAAMDPSKDLVAVAFDLDRAPYEHPAARCNLLAVTGIRAGD